MPFADHRGLVAGLLQQFWKSLLIPVKHNAVSEKTIQVVIFSGLDNGPTGTTYRIGHVAAGKPHALVGQSVHIGCGHPAWIVGANCLFTVIIGKDEHYIRLLLRC
jgi:hypothetical protein